MLEVAIWRYDIMDSDLQGRRNCRVLAQFFKFSLVGLSGSLLNLAAYVLALRCGVSYLLAAVMAFGLAVTSNFYWNWRWTFGTRMAERRLTDAYGRFVAISAFNLGVNLLLLGVFVEVFSLSKPFAQLVSIAAVGVLNYLMNVRFTFRSA